MSNLSRQLREALTDAGVYEQDPVIVEFDQTWNQALLQEADDEEVEKKKKARRTKTQQMLQQVKARINREVKETLQAGRLEEFMNFLRNEVRGSRGNKGRGAQDPAQMNYAAQYLSDIVTAVYSDEAPADNKVAAYVRKLVDEDHAKREGFERSILDKDRQGLHPNLAGVLGKLNSKIANELSSAVDGYVNREDDEDVVAPNKKDPSAERDETLGASVARINQGSRDLGYDVDGEQNAEPGVDTPEERTGTPDTDAYDVQVIQKMGDRVLAKVKGLSKGKAVQRYMTLTADELQRVTGSADLGPGNIHDYVHSRDRTYKTKKKELEGKFKSASPEEQAQIKQELLDLKQRQRNSFKRDPSDAYSRLREGQQKPEKFEDWLKQQVGSSAKEGLLNAAHRKAQTGDLDKRIISLIMQMNDEQANTLIRKASKDAGKANVVAHLDRLRQEFGPTAESVDNMSVPINERFGDTLRRMGRALKRKLTPDDVRYAKRLLTYDAAVQDLADNPGPMIRMMQKAGNARQMQRPARGPVEVTPTWSPDSEVTDRRVQALMNAFKAFDNAGYSGRVRELVDQITGGDKNHPAQQILRHLANNRPIEAITKIANSRKDFNQNFIRLERAYEKLSAEKEGMDKEIDTSLSKNRTESPKVDTSRLEGVFEKIAPMLAQPQYLDQIQKYAQAYEKQGLNNAVSLVKAIAAKDLRTLSIATQDATLFQTLNTLLEKVIMPIYLRWANDIEETKSEGLQKIYSAAILESPEIAEARIDAHDLAEAGIDLYVHRCQVLGRSNISKMYDAELDKIFEDLVESAYGRFREYCDLMETKMDFLRMDSFSDLVAILSLTEDPISRSDMIREYVENPAGVISSYRKSLIAPPKKSKYGPISNII